MQHLEEQHAACDQRTSLARPVCMSLRERQTQERGCKSKKRRFQEDCGGQCLTTFVTVEAGGGVGAKGTSPLSGDLAAGAQSCAEDSPLWTRQVRGQNTCAASAPLEGFGCPVIQGSGR